MVELGLVDWDSQVVLERAWGSWVCYQYQQRRPRFFLGIQGSLVNRGFQV